MDPSNEIAVIEREVRPANVDFSTPLNPQQLAHQVALIQEAMGTVMHEGEHYGKVPGCGDRFTLFKPGAEKLCLLFRIATDIEIEDLSDLPKMIRYRVKCVARHIGSDAFLGTGIGECSSYEEKYAWRDVRVVEEFDAAPPDQRRERWTRDRRRDGTPIVAKQVRVNPFDLGNTILKMAKKRALVDMALTVTAASDIFGQDLEDLERTANAPTAAPADPAPEGQKAWAVPADHFVALGMLVQQLGLDYVTFFETVKGSYGVEDVGNLKFDQFMELGGRLRAAIEAAAAGDGESNDTTNESEATQA